MGSEFSHTCQLLVPSTQLYSNHQGGRADIGYLPQWTVAWLMSQDNGARKYMMQCADTSGRFPWNYFDRGNNTWLTARDHPLLWIDGRCSPYLPCPANFPDASDTYIPDTAHQPELAYIPYMITGSRWYLDRLQAQGAFAIVAIWPSIRSTCYACPDEAYIVTFNEQVRSSAWCMREILYNSYINPDNDRIKSYFSQAITNNWQWVLNMSSQWQMYQGQAYGWLPGVYAQTVLPPWMEDYLASSVAISALQGNQMARQFFSWMKNFLVGRFLAQSQGFNPRNGITYNIYVGNVYASDNTTANTWAAIQSGTVDIGQDNGNGWANSAGNYGQLGIATLVLYLDVFPGDAQASQALTWLEGAGAPFTELSTLQDDPTFALDIYQFSTSGSSTSTSSGLSSTSGCTVECTDPNSHCEMGVCVCNSGFSEVQGVCASLETSGILLENFVTRRCVQFVLHRRLLYADNFLLIKIKPLKMLT